MYGPNSQEFYSVQFLFYHADIHIINIEFFFGLKHSFFSVFFLGSVTSVSLMINSPQRQALVAN